MIPIHFPEPHHPNTDVPDEHDPGAPPVEPDRGPPPSRMPDDPEHPRVIDPAASQDLPDQPDQHMRHQIEAAQWQ